VQGVGAAASIHDLSKIQSSFKQQEGLGGSTSARGIARNRFVGRGILVWNSELRWEAIDFRFFGEQSHVVLSSFLDQGRVWEDDVDFGELFSDLHRGYGGGVRLVFGEDFTVAYDFGTSAKTGLQVYIGLGYLY
jgi:hemolysin activation/secretion protein